MPALVKSVGVSSGLRFDPKFPAGVREYLNKSSKGFDPRKIIGFAREMMKEVVEDRIRTFGSKNKA